MLKKSLFLLASLIVLAACRPMLEGSRAKHDDQPQAALSAYRVEARLTDDQTGVSIIGIELDKIALTTITPDGSYTANQGIVNITMPRLRVSFSAVAKTAGTHLACEVVLPLAIVKGTPMPVISSASCKAVG